MALDGQKYSDLLLGGEDVSGFIRVKAFKGYSFSRFLSFLTNKSQNSSYLCISLTFQTFYSILNIYFY